MGSNHIIISIKFFSSTAFITQVIHLADEYTDTDKYSKMAFRSCLCLICHTTSSSPLIFQELELLLPAQSHKECQDHGSWWGRKSQEWEEEGRKQQCLHHLLKEGCSGRGNKKEESFWRRETRLFTAEKMGGVWGRRGNDSKGLGQESSWAGDTKVPQLPRLEGHIICHWKGQFPRLATKPLLLSRTFKAEASDDPLYLRDGGSSTSGNKHFSLFCVKNSYSIINFWQCLQSAELIHF